MSPSRGERSQVRQLIVGLVALPLTAIPFVGYANLTPEGRLVRDRAMVALKPPSLPALSPEQKVAAAAAAPQYQGAVMALAYHGIGSSSDGEGGFVVSPKRFAEHLATLKAAGMRTVTAAQVAAAFAGGEPLPPRAVMLSFDDGRADAMMFADPLLAQAGMSATMFVITGAASKPGVYYASWDRIESYARSGRWDIQSHTANAHSEQKVSGGGTLPALTSRGAGESLSEYQSRIRDDLAKASATIQEHVGRRPVAFAYPFGAYGADRNNDRGIAAVIRQEVARQYAIAFQQDDQETVPLLTPNQDPLLLRRVEVENWSGTQLLKRIDHALKSTYGPAPVPSTPPGGAGQPPPNAQTQAGAAAAPSASSGSPTAATGQPQAGNGLLSVPGVSLPDRSELAIPPVDVTLPPVTVTVPPVNLPPTTIPPLGSSPTTSPPPTTRPPTTSPPPTSPPTTACKQAGKSGKCSPGQG